MPNTNQTLFIVIFSLIAVVIVLLTYVCWLKRMKMAAKKELLYNQHQSERGQQQQQQYQLSSTQLQQMKPVLLQKLYDQDLQRQRQYQNEQVPQYTPHSNNINNSNSSSNNNNDFLVNINDESERDATIIHTTEQPQHRTNVNNSNSNHPRNNNQQLQNPFEG